MSYWREPRIGILEIAAGVTIGILAANTIEAVAISAYANYQILMMEERLKSASQERQRQARQADQARASMLEEHAQRRQQKMEMDTQRANAIKLAEQKKDQAWKSFYQQPRTCENMPNNDTFVKCSNEYIRQRRKFEETYQP